jgi:hypothetical protein
MSRVIAILVALCATARAERVLVADSDPALRDAITKSLAPWKIDVVLDPTAPGDAGEAATRANARYVVWRDGDELVVFDRDTGQAERRPAHAGNLDALGAAAAALSVKTMLRLPPLETHVTAPAAPLPADDGSSELRLEAGAGSRAEYGLDSNVALRLFAGAAFRPWHDAGWRFGAFGDLGAPATVDQAGFHGHWTNWALLGSASWAATIAAWEVGPWLGAGIEHSSLTGDEMGMSRHEEAILLAIRGGVTVRYRIGDWSLGGVLALEGLPATRTYTKLAAPAQVFEIPPIGATLYLVISCDLSDRATH